MKSHIEHTGVPRRHVCSQGLRVGGGWIRQDPSCCFPTSCLTVMTPDPVTSLDELAHYRTWEC